MHEGRLFIICVKYEVFDEYSSNNATNPGYIVAVSGNKDYLYFTHSVKSEE